MNKLIPDGIVLGRGGVVIGDMFKPVDVDPDEVVFEEVLLEEIAPEQCGAFGVCNVRPDVPMPVDLDIQLADGPDTVLCVGNVGGTPHDLGGGALGMPTDDTPPTSYIHNYPRFGEDPIDDSTNWATKSWHVSDQGRSSKVKIKNRKMSKIARRSRRANRK